MHEGLPNTQICPLDLGSKERQLRNSDLFMTYLIVAAGFVVSVTIFIAELLIKIFYRKKADKHPNFSDAIRESEFDNNKKEKLFHIAKKAFNAKNKQNSKRNDEDEDFDILPPPPSYHALFRPPFAFSPNGVKKLINGREYWVIKGRDGETRLVPMRSPSAFLYTYTN